MRSPHTAHRNTPANPVAASHRCATPHHWWLMVTGGKSWPEESPAQPPLTASRPQVGDYRTTPSPPKTRSRTRWMEWTRPHPVARAGRGDQAAEVRGQRPTLRSKVEAERGRLRCVPFRLLASFFSSEKCLTWVSPSPFPSGNPPPSHDWCGTRPLPGVAAGSSEADLLSGCSVRLSPRPAGRSSLPISCPVPAATRRRPCRSGDRPLEDQPARQTRLQRRPCSGRWTAIRAARSRSTNLPAGGRAGLLRPAARWMRS